MHRNGRVCQCKVSKERKCTETNVRQSPETVCSVSVEGQCEEQLSEFLVLRLRSR